ncbi:MAG: DsbA family protein [Gaiellaceae bacterium]
MPSGKQSKRLRRAAMTAPPPVRGKGRHRRASPRVLLIATAVVVLTAIGVTLGVVFTSGSSKSSVPARGSLVNALPGAADVQRLLQGIPQRGNVLGSPSAPVTLVEYVDLQCPFCQQFETQAMPALIERYVRTGKVKIEARLIGFIGPDSQRGRAAAIAAGEQNRLFNLAEILYQNQGTENTGWLNDEMIVAAAASIPGLDVPRLLDGRNSAPIEAHAGAYDRQAAADNVRGTPTILVGKSAGTLRPVALTSATDSQSVASAINAALRS